MSYATADDVALRLGRDLTAAELKQAEAFLDDLEADILVRLPLLASWIAADPNMIRTVIAREAFAVARVLRNPGGKRQESIDDYSWTTDTAQSSGALYLSDAEWASLVPAETSQPDAFSIVLSYER